MKSLGKTIAAIALVSVGISCSESRVETSSASEALTYVGSGYAEEEAGKLLSEIDQYIRSTTTTTSLRQSNKLTSGTTTDLPDNKWDRLAECETGGNWQTNTGNGFGGGLQFAHSDSWSTWRAFGGEEFAQHPWDASRDQQIIIAERVLASSGWNAWPGCARLKGWLG